MKRTGIITIIIIAALLILWVVRGYNKLVKSEERVEAQWAQVENVYQRRADLIPNLVATVKGYAEHERETLEAVIKARSEATSMKIDPTNINESDLAKFEAVQNELSSALSRLMVVVERYPDLKANQNFLELQAQLEGTENRITVERMKFNEEARNFNTFVRVFPRSLIAKVFGFQKKAYFAAQEGADKAPEVQF